MLELWNQIDEAAEFIRSQWTGTPRVGLILGTGLGGLAEQIDQEACIDYEKVPHFPRSTVESHAGRLVCGTLRGVPIVAMEGRFHYYEGYSLKQVTFPVRDACARRRDSAGDQCRRRHQPPIGIG